MLLSLVVLCTSHGWCVCVCVRACHIIAHDMKCQVKLIFGQLARYAESITSLKPTPLCVYLTIRDAKLFQFL